MFIYATDLRLTLFAFQLVVIFEMGEALKAEISTFDSRPLQVLRALELAGVVVFFKENLHDSYSWHFPTSPALPSNFFVGLSEKLAVFLMAVLKDDDGPLVALISEDPLGSKAISATDLTLQVKGPRSEGCDGYFESYAKVLDFLEDFLSRIKATV